MTPIAKFRTWFSGICVALAVAAPVAAGEVRDNSLPIRALPGYEKSRLVGRWYEVARTPSRIEPDCHAVTADVETRDDSRLTLKIECHKGSVTGPVLNIDSILVDLAPAVFRMRLVRLRALGEMTLVVLWQSEDDSLAVIGEPGGKLGWIWSKSPDVDAGTLSALTEELVAAGYSALAIQPVAH